MNIKKVLATMLAATLLAMPIVAGATDQATPAPAPTPAQTGTPTVEKEAITKNEPVAIGGTVIKSDVAGAFAIPEESKVTGLALRESAAEIKTSVGLEKNEKAFVTAYVTSPKKSPLAYAAFNAAATSVGATVVEAMNIDLGKMAGGKFADLPEGVSVPTTVGVKNAAGRTLAVAKAAPGGQTTILQDQDDNPDTVTFPVSGGLAAYAIIAYDK